MKTKSRPTTDSQVSPFYHSRQTEQCNRQCHRLQSEIIRMIHVSAFQVHLQRLQNEINVVLQCNP